MGVVHPGAELQLTTLSLGGLAGHVAHGPAVNMSLEEVEVEGGLT